MPIALRPDKNHVTVWLASDDDIPAEQRPSFVVRHLPVSSFIEAEDIRKEIGGIEDNKLANAGLNRLLKLFLVGIKNFPDKSTVDGVLDDVLHYEEKWELLRLVHSATSLSPKKNSPSPSSLASTPDSSAKDAPAPASVPNPSTPNPSLSNAIDVPATMKLAQTATELAK